MAIVKFDDVKCELAIDYVDDMVGDRIKGIIDESEAYLASVIGSRVADYADENDDAEPLLKRLALMYIGDIYDSRGVAAGSKLSNAAEKRQHCLIQQCLNGYRLWLDGQED